MERRKKKKKERKRVIEVSKSLIWKLKKDENIPVKA